MMVLINKLLLTVFLLSLSPVFAGDDYQCKFREAHFNEAAQELGPIALSSSKFTEEKRKKILFVLNKYKISSKVDGEQIFVSCQIYSDINSLMTYSDKINNKSWLKMVGYND